MLKILLKIKHFILSLVRHSVRKSPAWKMQTIIFVHIHNECMKIKTENGENRSELVYLWYSCKWSFTKAVELSREVKFVMRGLSQLHYLVANGNNEYLNESV